MIFENDSLGEFVNICAIWAICTYLLTEYMVLYSRFEIVKKMVLDHSRDIDYISEKFDENARNETNIVEEISHLKIDMMHLRETLESYRNDYERPSTVNVTSEDVGQLDDIEDLEAGMRAEYKETEEPIKIKNPKARKPRKKAADNNIELNL